MKKIVIMIIAFFCFANVLFATEVSSFDELKTAIANGETQIDITDNIEYNALISLSTNVVINGNNHKFNRSSSYNGRLFTITAAGVVEINNLTIDGGAPGWSMDLENRYYTQAENKGYIRIPTINGTGDIIPTTALIGNAGNLTIKNVTFKNIRTTASGSAISGAGNNTISDSEFNHICSNKNGGVIYISGGTTNISNTKFIDNTAGCGSVGSINGGSIYAAGGSINITGNSLMENNIAQANGGAIYVAKANVHIKDTTFRENKVGNDGSVIHLASTDASKTLLIEDSIFEKNYGLATTGQSMGTIWLTKWPSTEAKPLVMKNLVFKDNIARVGGAVADLASDTYAYYENIEVSGCSVNSGAAFYCQNADATIVNLNVHDNVITSQGAGLFVSGGAKIKMSDSTITNNTAGSSGGAIYLIAGEIELTNTTITNNTSPMRGGGIFVRGYYDGYNPVLTINNSIIKDNKAEGSGGGICVADNPTVITKVTIDDQTKIYDNVATGFADDFVYVRNDDVGNDTNQTVTLDNISIAGINGIDGWYHDNENDRFATTDNPTKFENFVGYKGAGIFLKAAGVSTIDYDLVGGSNDNIEVVTVKYGVETQISDDIPEKEGYLFTGWNTEATGSGTSVQPGSTYDGKGGLMLYAQYVEDKNNNGIDDSTEPHYTVEFVTDENGTLEGPIKYENVLTGLTFEQAGINIPTIKPKEGYIVSEENDGWDIKPGGVVNKNLKYTAQYKAIEKEEIIEVVEVNETQIDVPKTEDSIIKYFSSFFISLIGTIVISIVLKKSYDYQS